jgi:hypothetical protein
MPAVYASSLRFSMEGVLAAGLAELLELDRLLLLLRGLIIARLALGADELNRHTG